ncbi:nucleoside recognition protein [Desulfobacula sp.]
MKHGKIKPDYRGLVISLLISFIIISGGIYLIETITFVMVLNRLFIPLIRLMAFITIGLVLGQYLELSGLTKNLSTLARPLFRFGRLGNRCGSAFTTAFVSGVAANSMLLEFYQDGKISKKQVYLTNFVNHLPAYFLHLPTTFFIVLPLTGKAGLIYFSITLLATLLRVFMFLIYGHIFLAQPQEYHLHVSRMEESTKEKKKIWQSIRKKLPGRITKVFIWILPIYIFIYVINAAGLFKFLNSALSNFIVTKIVPAESLSVVILSFVAEFTSGFAAAGALLASGVITVKQTVIALLTGNIIAFPIRAIRHQLPRYIGIFSPKMGTGMLLMGQFFRISSIIFIGVGYYLLF